MQVTMRASLWYWKMAIVVICCSMESMPTFARSPADGDAKPKVWWFHGATETTREGITADLEAFQKAGIGGVVYYDQVHEVYGSPTDVFSEDWWQKLYFSAKEAKRLGLSFELNMSNGYAAGGPWIDEEHAMQRLVVVENDSIPKGFHEIATVAIPLVEDDGIMRYITYSAKAQAKSPTSAMNIPCVPGQQQMAAANFTELSPIGNLQGSDDSIHWQEVCASPPIYNDMGWKLPQLTCTFNGVRGRYFRVVPETAVRWFRVGSEPRIDRWEEKAAFRSNFRSYEAQEDLKGIHPKDVLVNPHSLPAGSWRILHFGYMPTGAKIKHGRKGMTGYECDRMSREAAELQYNNYFRRIADSLKAKGCRPQGVIIDSHEAGTQNWTSGLEKAFQQKRGYSLLPWLPVLQGYIIGSRKESERVLHDFRMTLSELVSERFFGILDSLARRDGYTFTAQAIGNGMCFAVDNIAVKGTVQKPQGEFWTYQTLGAYDIKEAASAARVYGKPIASAEAFTDCGYDVPFEQLRHLADFAFAMGINELVVCASPHQPRTLTTPLDIDSRHPYALNRNHPKWKESYGLWKYLGEMMEQLRQGKPASSIGICLGEEAPLKLLSHRLPAIPDGYEWDVFTCQALDTKGTVFTDSTLVPFRLLAIEDFAYIPLKALYRFMEIVRKGTPLQAHRKALEQNADYYGMLNAEYRQALDLLFSIPHVHNTTIAEALVKEKISPELEYTPKRPSTSTDRLYFTHRRTAGEDLFFIYNRSPFPFRQQVKLMGKPFRLQLGEEESIILRSSRR